LSLSWRHRESHWDKRYNQGQSESQRGVVKGVQMKTYGHDIRLFVGSDNFKIEGYFADDLPIAALLGRNGFFDKYVISFDPTGTAPGFELNRVHKR
jgi:hypothetical protein